MLKQYRKTRTVTDLHNYLHYKNKYKEVCKCKRLHFEKSKIQNIEASVRNPKKFWREIKNITGTSSKSPNISLTAWYEHFSSVFAHDDQNTEVPQSYTEHNIDQDEFNDIEQAIFNEQISENEIMEVIKSTNVNKSTAGPIPTTLIVNGSIILMPLLHKLFNRLFTTGEFPSNWTESIIIPLHKKGDTNIPNNYRGIALIDSLSKLYISILTKRVTFYINAYSLISECQSGFRSGYSTVDNAYVLYSIVSKYLNMKRKPIYVAFIDFQKPFDSVDRNLLFEIIHKNGIKGKLFTAITSIYSNVKAKVKTETALTDPFVCPVGLRQGCSLSPILFSLFINELNTLLCNSDIRGIQMFPNVTEIFLLMFADDIG